MASIGSPTVNIGGIKGNSPINKYIRTVGEPNRNASANNFDYDSDNAPLLSLDGDFFNKLLPSIVGPTNNIQASQNQLVYLLVGVVLLVMLWRD